jgi:kinesin family protein C1
VQRAIQRRNNVTSTAAAPSVNTTEDIVVEEEEMEDIDAIESAGLKSRLKSMQKKIVMLEDEKMKLSMAKAPLETRLRQNSDAFEKQKQAFEVSIEELKNQIKSADEKYRGLELKSQCLKEENTKLSFEVRKASSTLNDDVKHSDDSAWSRQLANDAEIEELKEKIEACVEEIQGLKLDKISLESDIHASSMELDALRKSYKELESQSDNVEAALTKASEAEIRLEVLTREHIATSAQLNAVSSDLAATRSSSEAAMDEATAKWKEQEKQLRFEISVMRTRGGNFDENDLIQGDDVEDEAVLRARIEERDRTIAEMQEQLVKGEQQRRKMHNRIQELRGNIRVFVRTRPFLPGDGDSDTTSSAIDVSADAQSVSVYDKTGKADNNFQFDKAFAPSMGQDQVFEEVSEFVQSALDGFHVCLFSYGQTGSGKTHTMQGSGNGAMRGIIPRAVEQILEQASMLQTQGWKYRMSASFLEIYNEDLRDLLVNMDSDGGVSTKKGQPANAPKLAIKRDTDGKSFVENLVGINIDTTDSAVGMQQLENVMDSAARTRSVACTNMNAQSSRSHSVFMLHLHGYNDETGTTISGALNLCDLAGSERLDRSGAGADAKRLKETQAINKSLSCLGDVFNGLASKASHVPYRNSKLTYLLQDCLSGDGKSLMFVNLSPTMESAHESLCSLRFAQRVSQVELGKPTKHVQYNKK